MAKITLTGEFTQIPEESGIVQNTSQFEPVEIATTQEKGSGIILQPGEHLQFASAESLYARSASGGSNIGGFPCTISVEPIMQSTMDVNLDEIAADVGDIKSYVSDIKTYTTGISLDVDSIESVVRETKTYTTSIALGVDSIDTIIGDIKTYTTSIQADVATIKGNLLFQLDGDNNIQPGNGGV